MPEGHTIHRLARDLNRDLAGHHTAVTSPQGRFAEEAGELDGERLAAAEAWGKHLFLDWSDAGLVHIHLGLIGKMRRHKNHPEPRDSVRMRLAVDELCWDLIGPMVCATISGAEREDILSGLGPDPLRDDADADVFVDNVTGSRRSIAVLLLDQGVIAGVGNVYRAEVLFLAGINPRTRGCDLDADRVEDLWREIRRLLEIGVRLNRIVTRDPDEVGKSPSRMRRDERLYAYKQSECRRCGSALHAQTVGGRTIHSCESCQPPGGGS